jgi:hypothetical protein
MLAYNVQVYNYHHQNFNKKGQFFSCFISIPYGQGSTNMIEAFKVFIGIPQMCGAIEISDIKLVEKWALELVIMVYYWNRHDHHTVVLQNVFDNNLIFWDVDVLALVGTQDATHPQASSLYMGFMHREIS